MAQRPPLRTHSFSFSFPAMATFPMMARRCDTEALGGARPSLLDRLAHLFG